MVAESYYGELDDQSKLADGASGVKSEKLTVEASEQKKPLKKKKASTPYKKGSRVGKKTYQARMESLNAKYEARLQALLREHNQSSSTSALEKDLIKLDDRLQDERKARAQLEARIADMAKRHDYEKRKLIDENTQLKAQLAELREQIIDLYP